MGYSFSVAGYELQLQVCAMVALCALRLALIKELSK